MAHVLGWVGRDRKGLEGLELYLDEHLRGIDGWRGTITDARRRAMGRSEAQLRPPQDGGHVVLTIDAEIQRIVEDAVLQAVSSVHAESGIGLVMNPYTGEVLAMGCWPAFDPNDARSVPASLRRNRALTDPTEPGSTFKPFIASGALEGRFVNTTEKIDCHMGKHYFGGRLVTDTKPRGILDLKGIIAKSSNIGMGKMADRMGNPALYDTVRKFKFGEKTGVEFPGEDPGVVYTLPKWGKMTTQSVAMGYEVMVTPLQLARAFAGIVNDGVLVRPRLVRQLLAADGTVVKTFEPQIAGRAISPEVARWMRDEALVAVVQEGGGNKAECEHYTVLGKTGTAKLMFKDRPLYEPGAYLGTFVGAAPGTRPELVALVMIRRPDASKAYYGGSIAAPAVSAILEQSLAYLGVPPDKQPVEKVAARP
jgi:cell division protein FtsI (penicillin-binding protein 3)